uniref:Uncharacterized protein n=1 Tax=Setaria digitata TaxID=48799 RepID=A0A915PPG2_9BILA
MTLSIPAFPEISKTRMPRKKRKMSLDALSESFRTMAAITGRRNSTSLPRKTTKKMKKSRLIAKNGICNVYNTNVPKKDRQYLRDIFTTMIDVKWRYMLVIFAIVFISSWTVFASFYYVTSVLHGDIRDQLDSNILNHSVCIENIDSFFSSFLFAVETHHTIGYGHRYITTECPIAGVIICLQCICALLIQSFMVGLVFAKMARPKKRAETIIFSEKAVICLRDGQFCFLCRVGDMRNTHLVEAHVRLQFITDRETAEGEIEPLHQYEMKVGPSTTDDDRIFLVWPTTLCHVIDRDSPLYDYDSTVLLSAQFEIIVLLEGIVESTGMTAQARTSYLPSEILWGHRFKKLVTYQRSNGSYQIDYGIFHSTYEVKTPTCSASQFHERHPKNSEFFEHDEQIEHPSEDMHSTGSTPTPVPSPYLTENMQSSAPTIIVQCPSSCNSPGHLDSVLHFEYDNNEFSSVLPSANTTDLSDFEEEK